MKLLAFFILVCLQASSRLTAQGAGSVTLRESFDTARVPLLPSGWTTTKAKAQSGDFSTSSSTAYSAPAAALATDARVSQQLISPVFSLKGKTVRTLEFYERRSSSFTAGLVVEAAPDQKDTLSWRAISDTLTLLSSSAYVRRTITLPRWLDDQPAVRVRWRTLGNGTGATGTLRIDDIALAVERAADLSIDPRVALSPPTPEAGEDCSCSFTIRNNAPAGQYAWSLELRDSARPSPVARASYTHSFAANDSFTVSLTYPAIAGGMHVMRCRLVCAEDEDTLNNDVRFTVSVGYAPGSIVVNEIMYEPLEDEAEYLELFNRSAAPVDLRGWTLADGPASKKNRNVIQLSASAPHVVAPGAYCVVADDSTVIDAMRRMMPGSACEAIIVSSLGLNNTGDNIILSDASGRAIETIGYSPLWHLKKGANAGRSLERINPELAGTDARNWTTSVAKEGGTPGAKNSVYTSSIPTEAALELSPNPFSPDGDGREDFLAITYALQSTAMTLRVRIFDAAGRLVRTLANNEPAAARGTVIWNGRDDADARVRIGIYVVFLEALDVHGAVFRTLKGAAVVAARLE